MRLVPEGIFMSFITHTQMLHGHDGSNLEIGEDRLPGEPRGYVSYFTSYAASVGDATESAARIFGRGGAPWLTIRHCAGLNRHVAQPPASEQSDPANF
jgi:hypothetical protein